jgi:hypothetical protein
MFPTHGVYFEMMWWFVMLVVGALLALFALHVPAL